MATNKDALYLIEELLECYAATEPEHAAAKAKALTLVSKLLAKAAANA